MLYAKIKSEFDTVVDKCQVRIVVGDEPNAALRKHANEVFDKRDERLKSMTDESVPVFYSCIMCRAFSSEPRLHRHPGASGPVRCRVLAGREGHERA